MQIHKGGVCFHQTTPSYTPLHVTLLCCVHDHTPAAHTHLLLAVFTCSIALLTPCSSQCWQWAKLDGVTITLLIPAASLILLPNRICPHALSLISPFLPLSPPTFQFHLSALSLSPLPLLGIVSKRATISQSGSYWGWVLCQHSESNASHCQGRLRINPECPWRFRMLSKSVLLQGYSVWNMG